MGLLAIVLTWLAFIPYYKDILRGNTQPHLFSWVIWAFTTWLVFVAQWLEQGGWGAYPIGVSALLSTGIMILIVRSEFDKSITKMDWVFFTLALASIPLWWITEDPAASVAVLTLADLLGFAPTLRKAYQQPEKENVVFYLLFSVRNFLSLLALESYSFTTVIFPASIGAACLVVVAILVSKKYRNKSTA